MWVRAICTHFDKHFHREGDEWEHSGPLYEHIVQAEKADDEPTSRQQKPTPPAKK